MGARNIMSATALSKSVLVAAVIGAGLSYLIVGSHVRGIPAPIEPIRASLAAEAIVSASVDVERAAVGLSSARPSPSGELGTKFRFGFLEFEDHPDASAE